MKREDSCLKSQHQRLDVLIEHKNPMVINWLIEFICIYFEPNYSDRKRVMEREVYGRLTVYSRFIL